MFNKDSYSIHTIRVKLKSLIEARKALADSGFTSTDGVTYSRKNRLETTESLGETSVTSHQPSVLDEPVIVTSYLIGSRVPEHIWKAITNHCESIGAKLVVIAHRYKNPTTLEQSIRDEEGEEYIDPRVKPYLAWEDFYVHGHRVAAGVRINPTNINPLARAKRFCTGHTVIGHSIQSLLVTPTLVDKMPNVLWATGTISEIDKADNLTASVAQFHYKFGWIVIDNDGSTRNVHATKKGQFTDQDILGWNGAEWVEPEYLASVLGDYHYGQHCPEATKWALDWTRRLKPERLILHDYIDGATVNPHASRYERSLHFGGDLEKELFRGCCHLIDIAAETGVNNIGLVVSNHNDMVSRYLNRTTPSEMSKGEQLVLARWLLANKSPERMVANWVNELKERGHGLVVSVLNEDSPSGKINLNLHGDVGSNGARGSVAHFFQLAVLAVIGHTHTPAMLGGIHGVGTMTRLRLGYNNRGLSNWLNSFLTVNSYNKCQHYIKFF